MSYADALLGIADLGLNAEQYAGVLRALACVTQGVTQDVTGNAEPTANALRQRKFRAQQKALRNAVTVTNAPVPSPPPAPSPDKEIPPTPPKENNLFPEPPPQPRFPSAREFDDFWARFPNKVGKADAFKAFDRAVKRVDIVAMMAGLDRYVAKTDDRPWCNPSTWLNQDRWTDQPAQTARGSPQRGGNGPKGLEWFDEAIDWIDENERRRTETGSGSDQNDDRSSGQLAIGHRR